MGRSCRDFFSAKGHGYVGEIAVLEIFPPINIGSPSAVWAELDQMYCGIEKRKN